MSVQRNINAYKACQMYASLGFGLSILSSLYRLCQKWLENVEKFREFCQSAFCVVCKCVISIMLLKKNKYLHLVGSRFINVNK